MSTTDTQEDIDQFTITFRREIVFYLRQLINEGERVSVMFNEGHETMLTVLIDVDEDSNQLIFDWGGSEEGNQRFLKCAHSIFVANPQGVRNQFVAGPARAITHNGRPAFAISLPEKYVRRQRRDFFRLVLPMTRRPLCRIKLQPQGQEQVFSVIDIGLGGIGLESPLVSMPVSIGQVLAGAMVDLKGPSALRMDLKIRYIGTHQRGSHQVGHLGCGFVKLSAGQENELQKFITLVQREERSKLG